MDNATTRRKFLVGLTTLGSAGAVSARKPQAQPAGAPDLLPSLRSRFGDQLHPDVRAVRLKKQNGILCLEMKVGTNATWAGSFCDFDGMWSCSELIVINELTCPFDVVDLSPTDSLEESTERLLASPQLELLGRMTGLISGRKDWTYNVPR